jgi:TAG lipase/lysophosphatidylethanolamine acyltransferase
MREDANFVRRRSVIGVHTESELLGVLSGNSINVEAFTNQATSTASSQSRWHQTLTRRVKRWWTTGHFLDIEVLDRLLQANIGDTTFEEAHKRTGRILNITVTTSTSGRGGSAPTSLNYITAPNVVSPPSNHQ